MNARLSNENDMTELHLYHLGLCSVFLFLFQSFGLSLSELYPSFSIVHLSISLAFLSEISFSRAFCRLLSWSRHTLSLADILEISFVLSTDPFNWEYLLDRLLQSQISVEWDESVSLPYLSNLHKPVWYRTQSSLSSDDKRLTFQSAKRGGFFVVSNTDCHVSPYDKDYKIEITRALKFQMILSWETRLLVTYIDLITFHKKVAITNGPIQRRARFRIFRIPRPTMMDIFSCMDAVSLTLGNSTFGTSLPRNSHSGFQSLPSLYSNNLSLGTILRINA